MPQCTVCKHPRRDSIDRRLIEGASLRDIARDFPPLSTTSISRHARNHLSPALMAIQAERVSGEGLALLARIEALISRTERLLDVAEREGRPSVALTAVKELRGLLELLGKASGELDDRPTVTVNLLTSPEWLTVRDAVIGALVGFPAARQVVAGRLLELEASGDE